MLRSAHVYYCQLLLQIVSCIELFSNNPGRIQSCASGSHSPACDTERPASSINWSIENAPVDMSS
jgi:hypothetical protein